MPAKYVASGYSDEKVRAVLAAALVAGPGVVITEDDAGDTVTFSISAPISSNEAVIAPDATTDTKGIVRLAGDLGGDATTPTVPGLVDKLDSATYEAVITDAKSRVSHTGEQAISTVTGLQPALDGKAPLAGVEGIKVHDGTATGGTRPTGYARVRWVGGTSQPTNMVAGDLWERDA